MKINDIEEENEELRFKLGMDPRDPLDLTEFRKNKELRKEEEKALNFILQKEVERLEDERIELKKKIRKLAQQTGQRSVGYRSRVTGLLVKFGLLKILRFLKSNFFILKQILCI